MKSKDKTASFIRELKWESLPEVVKRKALMCLLDNLGVTLVGTLAPVSRIAADYARESWSGDTSTIATGCGKASAEGAAFAGIVERKADKWNEVSLERKFRHLASYVLEPDALEGLVKMIWGFNNVTDIRELTRFFEKYLPG